MNNQLQDFARKTLGEEKMTHESKIQLWRLAIFCVFGLMFWLIWWEMGL